MLGLLKTYLKCELRYKVNLLSYAVIVLCSYFILQMGFEEFKADQKNIHALMWFVILYLMVFAAMSISDRYKNNMFEKGLMVFSPHKQSLFFVKIITHLFLLTLPIAIVFVLLTLQGIVFPTQTYSVYAVGIVLLSIVSQLLSNLLAQLPNKSIALPLLLFPCAAPVILFLFSVIVKSLSMSVTNEIATCFGMILIALSIGYTTSDISLEE